MLVLRLFVPNYMHYHMILQLYGLAHRMALGRGNLPRMRYSQTFVRADTL